MDDVVLNVDILNEFREARGLARVDLAHYRSQFILPASRFCARLLDLGADSEGVGQIAQTWHERYVAGWPSCPLAADVTGVIDAANAAGIRNSVLSATVEHFLRAQVAHFGLTSKLIGIGGTDNILCEGKAERGRRLMDDLGACPESTLLVGDTQMDLEVANALGVRCLLVDFGHANVAHLAGECIGIAHSMSEVGRLISSGCGPD